MLSAGPSFFFSSSKAALSANRTPYLIITFRALVNTLVGVIDRIDWGGTGPFNCRKSLGSVLMWLPSSE